MDSKVTPIKLCPPPRRKGGRKAWIPRARDRHHIKVMKAAGFSDEACARAMGVSETVLKKRCAKELANGAQEVNAKVANKLFGKCMKGDTVSLLFWSKTRLGWRETNRTEHTGADGGPIVYEQIEAEAAAFTQHIAQMAERFAVPKPANNDEPPAAEELTQKSTKEA